MAPGIVPYEAACAFMVERSDAIAAGRAAEMVWLVEHAPLYTAGTSARSEDLLQPGRFPVHPTGRGGQFTYHGPGQRVVYVMLDVKRRFGDVRAYVHALETWVIEALGELGVEGRTIDGRIGVWVRRQERRAGPRQDRGDRGAAATLGELARVQPECRSRPRALRRHRAVRNPRRRRDEPRRAGASGSYGTCG